MERRSTNLNEFERALGRLEGKMDAMVTKMSEMAASFDNLEKGRLSRLEISVAEMRTNAIDSARNTALWTSGIIAILISVIAGVILRYIK